MVFSIFATCTLRIENSLEAGQSNSLPGSQEEPKAQRHGNLLEFGECENRKEENWPQGRVHVAWEVGSGP